MPSIVLADVLTSAESIVTVLGPYLIFGVGVAFAPKLIRWGKSLLKGK